MIELTAYHTIVYDKTLRRGKHFKLGHRGLKKFSGMFWQEKFHFWICVYWC